MFSTYVTTMFISSHFNTLFSSVLRIYNINWRQRRRKILLLEMETCFCLLHAFASFDQTNYFHECTLPSFGFVFICASMCIHSILNTLIVLKLMSFPLSKRVRVYASFASWKVTLAYIESLHSKCNEISSIAIFWCTKNKNASIQVEFSEMRISSQMLLKQGHCANITIKIWPWHFTSPVSLSRSFTKLCFFSTV